ncbi:MAG: bile acid:sodium symporter family protein [Polymorphobacter sp.]
MDPVTIVKLTILASIFLIVVSIGMQTRPEDLLALKDNPRMAARAMLAMFVIVPLFVIFLTWALPLQPPIPAALIALSLSPMPPILPKREAKTGANADYVISLQVLAAVASLVLAPLYAFLVGPVFGRDISFAPLEIFKVLVMTIGAPLALGILIRRYAPAVARASKERLAQAGMVTLVIAVIVVLFKIGPRFAEAIGSGVMLTAIVISLFALGVGHWLGGPDERNRGALALTSAARHPGVAIALATATFTTEQPLILVSVLIYTAVTIIVTIPYIRWRKRVTARRG